MFVAGLTSSGDFPTTSGAYDTTYNAGSGDRNDVFVSKLSSDLENLESSTYIGGGNYEGAYSLYVTSDGVYVAGDTWSGDFPTTSGAYSTSKSGGDSDVFVSKLSLDLGNLESSTYIGGRGDIFYAIILLYVTSDGVFVAGNTNSNNFPTTSLAYDTSYNGGSEGGGDVFISKLSLDLGSLKGSTYFGGSGNDSVHSLFVTGDAVFVAGETWSSDFPTLYGAYGTNSSGYSDVFVSKLSLDLRNLESSTYLGGGDDDVATSLFVTSDGVFVTGWTNSNNFPTTYGAYSTNSSGSNDVFVSKFSLNLDTLKASTYLGERGTFFDDIAILLYVTSDGVFIAGNTNSTDFPTTSGAYDISQNGGTYEWGDYYYFPDVFVSKLSLDLGNLLLSTYLGGSDCDYVHSLFVTSDGVFVGGYTESDDFPTTYGEYSTSSGYYNVFISKLSSDLGTLISSTYLDKLSVDDEEYPIAFFVDNNSNVYIAGRTYSDDFPASANAYDTTLGGCSDAYVFYLSADYFNASTIVTNHSPVISSFTPLPSSSTAPITVTLTTNASDPDGDTITYHWDCDGDGSYEDSSSTNTHQCTYNTAGTYHPKVKVEDPSGASAEKETTVSVSSASGNNPPVISSITATPSSGFAPLTVTFTVSASDPEGDTLTYHYDFDGDGYWDKEGSENSVTHTYSTPGTYTAKVEVEDEVGLKDSKSVTITVNQSSSSNKSENKTDNTTGANASSSGAEKSSGCGCSVGDSGGNYFGDLLVFLLPLMMWIFEKKRKIYRGG